MSDSSSDAITRLMWFRNDLRLHDNEALLTAAEGAHALLPVYVFDSRAFGKTASGFPKYGPYRSRFLLESLEDLRQQLQARGSDLIILQGKPEELIPELCNKHGISLISYHEEATDEELQAEQAVDDAVDAMDVEVASCWGASLYHLDDLPVDPDDMPDVFTPFRKKLEKMSQVRPALPAPEKLPPLPEGAQEQSEPLPSADFFGVAPAEASEKSVLPFKGGEREGMRRLERYFWEGDHLREYKKTRNGMLGANYSSKFSAWLANGSLSPRYIYEEVKRYESERKKNQSTYWLVFELIWRDFFRFIFLKHGNRLFQEKGIKGQAYEWSYNKDAFRRWANAETGIPMIDANMRELNETGFMSNRGRQNVASFLTKNLNIDWRWGAEYFESLLVDYDVCSNWGNWAYNSGVGNDPRDRFFNIVGQGKRYDAAGDYVRHWLPELSDVPAEHVHTPHQLSDSEQSRYGVQIGHDYPAPMIDLEASYEAIKKRGA